MVAVFYLVALSIVFVGMSAVILPIVYGTPIKLFRQKPAAKSNPKRLSTEDATNAKTASEPLWSILPLTFAGRELPWFLVCTCLKS